MEEVASTPKLVDPADVDAKGAPSATFPRSDIEAALRDDAGADLFLEIARIQNGERNDTKIKVAWERSDLEALLQRASGDHVTLTFDPAELESLLDADVEAHGFREKALILTVAAATAAGMAGQASAHVLSDGGGSGSSAAVAGFVTDASTSGVPGSVASFTTDASTAAATSATADDPISVPVDGWTNAANSPEAAATPADGWTSAVESPVGGQAGINVVTDNTGGQPGSISGVATDASTSGQPGSVTSIASDVGSERTRTPAEPAVAGGGSGFSIPDSAIDGALAGGLALLITGAAFVTRTQRRREQPA